MPPSSPSVATGCRTGWHRRGEKSTGSESDEPAPLRGQILENRAGAAQRASVQRPFVTLHNVPRSFPPGNVIEHELANAPEANEVDEMQLCAGATLLHPVPPALTAAPELLYVIVL